MMEKFHEQNGKKKSVQMAAFGICMATLVGAAAGFCLAVKLGQHRREVKGRCHPASSNANRATQSTSGGTVKPVSEDFH